MTARTLRYADPLDLVWTELAQRLGMQVIRDGEVYASWDGRGVLRIGTPETLDADDCMAQMVLHEICHALVAGEAGMARADWGLEYECDDDEIAEHAALRLQAALAERYGLREFFPATTGYRPYYERLPADPLIDDGDPAVSLARAAWECAITGPWSGPLDAALQATRQIADAVADFAGRDSLWRRACAASS